ncbi:MAG: hypothetical protein BJ554DRAFT_3592 [Olpidium bornovanus]|uniref:Uncharacterized protein n=1 Tax=Olpidium bornovanus TaxID=278681 RepID=A0A8H7ZP01_9FUNG|nr:MAG: hypothetical protein BJ554DRAFT_3592 [Olpidium bornovanus]
MRNTTNPDDLAVAGAVFAFRPGDLREGTWAFSESSVNIAWNGPGMGDPEYLYAFREVVLPIAYEFSPDFVLGEFSRRLSR